VRRSTPTPSDPVPRSHRHGGRSLWWVFVLVLGAVACVTTLSTSELPGFHRTAAVEGASEMVGAEECETCHEDVKGWAPAPVYHADCETCHGSGELHIDSEEVSEIRFPSNADCETCHDLGHSTLLRWSMSEHNRSGVLCSDCHESHNREPYHVRQSGALGRAMLPNAGDVTRMCTTCHPDVAASFDLPSHHPLREGMLGCTDCHQPHGSRRNALLQRTEACAECHQDFAGPWIFEHAPVTEDCSYCHAPHGASSRALLETNEPGVCISCHSVAESGAVHDPWAFSTRCSDCHSAVHGSYSDPHLRR
jgi:DmsE family decaheme c-type cytochrome